jgi:hypothetical protein
MASKGSNGGGKFMDNAKGMCSYAKNPMPKAAEVSRKCGPGLNKDQQKADRLLQKAHAEKESLRGESGM